MDNLMNREQLINKTIEYADKVFFYCIKRCKTRMDAEDLSQTILLEVLNNINKGVEIKNFDYYIWGVCRNQYSSYIKGIVNKRNNEELVEGVNEAAEGITPLDEMLENEQILQINKSIKLLSNEYLQILYAYYIEDKTLKYISDALNLPLGTIKWKLSEIRRKLKEYLKMEKLNGKKAYVPERITFCASGNNFKTEPHDGVRTLMQQNILIHSYNNPCALEDYALELGVAMPYMEDFVSRLVDIYLLKKEGNKYITDFLIIDEETQMKIIEKQLTHKESIALKILKILKKYDINKLKFIGGPKQFSQKLWSLTLHILNIALNTGFKIESFTKRKDGSEWNFIGEEKLTNEPKDLFFVGNTGCGDHNGFLNVWNIGQDLFWDKLIQFGEINRYKNDLDYIIKNREKGYKALSSDQHIKYCLEWALSKELIKLDKDKIDFNFIILELDEYNNFEKELKTMDEFKDVVEEIKISAEETYNILKTNTPGYLNAELKFATIHYLSQYRSFVISYLMEQSELYLPTNDKSFPYNVDLIIK